MPVAREVIDRSRRLDVDDRLGGAERYSTHVSTDKPIYRPGEKLYVRAVVLRADTRSPLPADENQQAQIDVIGPKGDVWGAYVDACISICGTAQGASDMGAEAVKKLLERLNLVDLSRDLRDRLDKATERLGEVEEICDRVGVISQGRLVAESTVERIISPSLRSPAGWRR